jgi:hypothetical protein
MKVDDILRNGFEMARTNGSWRRTVEKKDRKESQELTLKVFV